MSDVQIQEFRDQIQHAAASKSVLSIQGGGSKAWYGNPNAHSKLLTTGFQGIVDYQPEELVITARAGTPLATIEAALTEKNQMLAFEPPHFGAQATFGGAIGAGLAGPGRISAGNLRDYVLGTRLMDGQGHDLSFGGKVMKNVAGYDVSRLLPGSLGTFALILEASVKVLPKPAGTASLRCFISEARALKVLNEWAGQPLPLSASSWIGSGDANADGELTIRLAGAVAAVQSATVLMKSTLGATELDPTIAAAFWRDLREHKLDCFHEVGANDALYRLALPAACPPIDFSTLASSGTQHRVLEWHGQQRWWHGPADASTQAKVKAKAIEHGGHASCFRVGTNGVAQRFTLLSDQAHSAALTAVQTQLRKAFDPSGVFATGRLP
jgi:glycolate oxidase FAD binding subunit